MCVYNTQGSEYIRQLLTRIQFTTHEFTDIALQQKQTQHINRMITHLYNTIRILWEIDMKTYPVCMASRLLFPL